MNEAEWLACDTPYDMLMTFPAEWDRRKLWLFGCAALRRVWHLLTDERTRRCVEVTERFVDNEATEQELAEAWEAFKIAAWDNELERTGFDTPEAIRSLICYVDPISSLQVATEVAEVFGSAAAQSVPVTSPESWSDVRTEAWEKARRQERAVQAKLLRCIFGNPFHSVRIDPSCLTWSDGTVVKVAKAVYDERRFDDMPILADALEDAGCGDEGILSHCRGPGPHVRGCWVVDLLLGKK